jgi:iron complex outermembrane recepter protein
MEKNYPLSLLAVVSLLSTQIFTLVSAQDLAQNTNPTGNGFNTVTTALPPAVQSSQQGADKKSAELEEITVTATRREESMERVPISIEALSQRDLDEGGIKDIADIAAVTPGLQYAEPGVPATLNTISIRGMNSNTGASVVGIYLDDTPIQGRISPILFVGNPYPVVFDLNRVEVARGPQGTLFGAGSEAGTLRFITNQPSLTEFSGFTHEEMASTQNGDPSYEIGAAAGGPIVEDKIGFRVSAWTRQDGGYVDIVNPMGDVTSRNVNKDDKVALRAALAFQLNDDLLITSSFHYQSIRADGSGRFWAAYSDPSTGQFNNGLQLPEVSTDHFTLPSIKVEARLPFAELTSTTSYLNRKVDVTTDLSPFLAGAAGLNYGNPLGPDFPESPSDAAPSPAGSASHGLTEELRLASNQRDAFVTWVAGIFYDRRTQADFQYLYSQVIEPTGGYIYFSRIATTDNQIAAFAQTDLHLTEKLTATLGERVAKVKSDLNVNNGNGIFNTGQPPVAFGTLKQTPNTPKLALSYQSDPNNLFYVSAGKGFRVGGGNVPLASFCGVTAPTSYQSDYVWSYEAGAKNRFLDGRVQIDSSVFRIDWSKIQQLEFPSCGLAFTFNAGSAVSKGFDLALQALVTDQLRVNVSVGYVDAYFTSNVYDSSGNLLILKGDAIGVLPQVNAPWNVNTSTNYEIPMPEGNKIYLRGEYQYNSRNPGPFITQIPTSPSYYPLNVADPPTHLTNARVGYATDKLDLTLSLNNVFNSHLLLSQFRYVSTSNLVAYSTFRPRTAVLSANYKF